MPKQDLGSFWGLMADLWSGLSPLLRVCGFGGMALGAGLGVWAVAQVSPAGVPRLGRLMLWVLIACAAVGAVLGLALGAALELLGKRREGAARTIGRPRISLPRINARRRSRP